MEGPSSCLLTFIVTPLISSILCLSEVNTGIFIGTVIHALPQAVSAGETFGPNAMIIATTVKLFRVSLLIIVVPLCVFIIKKNSAENKNTKLNLPYFIPGFIFSSCLSTWILPEITSNYLLSLGKNMLLPILAAVGFFINIDSIKNAGGSMLIVGIISTISMIIISIILLSL